MTLNKELLQTSEVYREIAALDCFSDEIEQMEEEALDDIVQEFQYLKEFQHFYDETLPEIEF